MKIIFLDLIYDGNNYTKNTMRTVFLNLLYFLDTTIQTILFKVLVSSFYVNDYVYTCFIKSILLPFVFYMLYKNYRDPKWYDVLNGFLDYLESALSLISFIGLSLGTYVTYRTSSIFFAVLFIYVHSGKKLSIHKYIGIFLIFIAIVLLLTTASGINISHSIICIISSLCYASINFIVEYNCVDESSKHLNFYWVKTISSLIGIIVALNSEYLSANISKSVSTNKLQVILLSLFIGVAEYFYFYFRIKIVSHVEENNSGSITLSFLDIKRRFMILMIGIIFFNESYSTIIYVAFVLMFIGSILGTFEIQLIKNMLIITHIHKRELLNNNNIAIDIKTIDVTTDDIETVSA